jgi:hypothetical protein
MCFLNTEKVPLGECCAISETCEMFTFLMALTIRGRSYHFVIAVGRAKEAESLGVRYWEIIADNLKKRGWSLGWVSAVDSNGRTIWIADAHCDDGKRFVAHAKE